MNFNSLNDKLKQWEKTNVPKAVTQHSHQPDPDPTPPRSGEKVVGGIIKWKPVDKAASKMLMKSSWIHQPPPERTETTENMNIKDVRRVDAGEPAWRKNNDGSFTAEKMSNEAQVQHLTGRAVAATSKAIDDTKRLVEQTKDAQEAFSVLTDRWSVEWIRFIETGQKRLAELRSIRMSTETETRNIMSQFKDVRAFFLDDRHDQEMEKLREFVELCERLQNLKNSGFLDRVADTIIRLA